MFDALIRLREKIANTKKEKKKVQAEMLSTGNCKAHFQNSVELFLAPS